MCVPPRGEDSLLADWRKPWEMRLCAVTQLPRSQLRDKPPIGTTYRTIDFTDSTKVGCLSCSNLVCHTAVELSTRTTMVDACNDWTNAQPHGINI